MIRWIKDEVRYNLLTVLYLNRKKDLEMKGSQSSPFKLDKDRYMSLIHTWQTHYRKFVRKFALCIWGSNSVGDESYGRRFESALPQTYSIHLTGEVNMITKEKFCEVIDGLKHNEKYLDDIRDVFKKHRRETQIYSTGLENTVINLLETIFKDEEDRWIDYWIWELDFGEKYEDGTVTDKDGTVIPLKTAEELYDFLIKEML